MDQEYGQRVPGPFDIEALAALVEAMSRVPVDRWPDKFMDRVGHVLEAFEEQFKSGAD